MTHITATLVKTLRDKTGAGVIACKNALLETQGDLEAAIEQLRAAEVSKAALKAGRVAAEGLVSLAVEGTRGAMIELNAETDFVARTDAFRRAAAGLAIIALDVAGDRDALLNAPSPEWDGTVSDLIGRLTARTGEHIHLRRCAMVTVRHGLVASYVHNAAAPGLGSIGVVVALESTADREALVGIGRKIAMHIAASAPRWVRTSDVPPEVVSAKRAELEEQARSAGKTPDIAGKIVEGRVRKFYEETVLDLQPFVLNLDQRVESALNDAEADAGAEIRVAAFARFQIGASPAAAGDPQAVE